MFLALIYSNTFKDIDKIKDEKLNLNNLNPMLTFLKMLIFPYFLGYLINKEDVKTFNANSKNHIKINYENYLSFLKKYNIKSTEFNNSVINNEINNKEPFNFCFTDKDKLYNLSDLINIFWGLREDYILKLLNDNLSDDDINTCYYNAFTSIENENDIVKLITNCFTISFKSKNDETDFLNFIKSNLNYKMLNYHGIDYILNLKVNFNISYFYNNFLFHLNENSNSKKNPNVNLDELRNKLFSDKFIYFLNKKEDYSEIMINKDDVIDVLLEDKIITSLLKDLIFHENNKNYDSNHICINQYSDYLISKKK